MAFAALVTIAGIAHQWNDATATPWWLVAFAAVALGLLYEWWRVRRYRLTATAAVARLHLGRREALTIIFANDEARPLSLQWTPHLPSVIEASAETRQTEVPAHGEHRETTQVRPVQLGEFPWPALPMRVRGPFGLGWWQKPQALNARLAVVPDLLADGAVRVGDARSGSARRAPLGVGRDLDHLRDYRPGDSRHAIDWKATARRSSLVTRVMREDQHLSIVLVIDAGSASRTRIDGMSQLGHYVNACARFTQYAVAGEDRVGLVAVADRPLTVLAPARGTVAVARIRTALGDLETEPAEADLVAAALAVRQAARSRSLVVLLTDLQGQTADGRLMQCIRLLVPKHLPVVVGLIATEVERLAAAPANEWLDPYVSLAAANYRRDLDAAAGGLRRLGAQPLVCHAADLEARLAAQYRMLKAQHRV